MKRFMALTLSIIFILVFSSCVKQVPPSQLPCITYNSNSLPILEILIGSGGENADVDGIGSEMSPEEIIVQYKDDIPMTEIFEGEILMIAGVIKNDPSIRFRMNFEGIYTVDGVKTAYTEGQLSTLPDGKYIICVISTKESKKETETKYFFAGIDKKTASNDGEVDGDVYDCFIVNARYGGNEEFYNSALNSELLNQNDKEHLPIFKFDTLNEYNKFISDYADIFSTNNLPDNFDEEYFSESTLLLVYKETNSSSYAYRIKKHDLGKAEICIYIEQANNPEAVDMAMDGWFIVLCLDKHITQDVTSFDAVFEK